MHSPHNVLTPQLVVMSTFVGISRGTQKFGSAVAPPLGMQDMADPRKYVPPHVLPCRCVRSRSDGTSVITMIRLKDLTPHFPPFKITQGHRNRHELIGFLLPRINVP